MKNCLTILLFLTYYFSYSQGNVGLIAYDGAQTYEGYTLIYPHNQPNVFLLNNCGEIVHTWEDSIDFRPGNTAYILPNGNLVKTKRYSNISQDSIWAGGGGAFVEIWSWEGDKIWSFELNNENFRLHHDIEVLPNGNILMIAWERKTNEEAILAGRDPSTLVEGDLWPEMIIEVDPTTDEIVWEWHVWDHLVQDFDDTQENFGVVSERPELININYDLQSGKADWLHANSIHYHPELRQIMLSIPAFNEIWVIDHNNTTEQAAGPSGDLLYRMGNLAAYDKGTEEDQLLFFQHSANWAIDFLTPSHEHYGKVMVFNNRVGEDYSTVEMFETTFNMYTGEYEKLQGAWPPYVFERTITYPEDPTVMHSTGLSSAQMLANGNVLICTGRKGHIFEITPDNEVVWAYILPLKGGQQVNADTELSVNDNLNFKATKYPMDYKAFENRDLTPQGFIELEPYTDTCSNFLSVSESLNARYEIKPNPATDMVKLEWDSGGMIKGTILNVAGAKMLDFSGNGGLTYIDVSSLNTNLYLIMVEGELVGKLSVVK